MAKHADRCRLYLQAPMPLTAKRSALLARAVSEGLPACVLFSENGADLKKVPAEVDRSIDIVQGAGIACLLETPESAAELGADGVHISADLELYTQARTQLGASANIGVACGLGRHEAMQLAEAGADYVAFEADGASMGKPLELVAWWSQMFVVPCVAWNVETIADAARFAQSGADFVAPPAAIWDNEDVIERLIDMDRAIGGNRRAA